MKKHEELMAELLEHINGGEGDDQIHISDELIKELSAVNSMEEAISLLERNNINISEELMSKLPIIIKPCMPYKKPCDFNTCPKATR